MNAVELHEYSEEEELPAWSLPAEAVDRIRVPVTLPEQVTREWAWGGSTGAGVRVCILDSGIELVVRPGVEGKADASRSDAVNGVTGEEKAL